MLTQDKTLTVTTFEDLIRDMCTRAHEELDATRARLEALQAERDPPG